VYHRFDRSVNQFVAFGRRFSLATKATPPGIERPFDTGAARRYSRRSEMRHCLSFGSHVKTCQLSCPLCALVGACGTRDGAGDSARESTIMLHPLGSRVRPHRVPADDDAGRGPDAHD
jgi:hypothetical protein